MVILDLDTRILMLLETHREKMRNSEIVKELWRKEGNKRQPSPAFNVKVTKRLTALVKQKLLERHTVSHKNVCYTIEESGHQQLQRSFLTNLVSELPPIEIQVLLTLTHLLITEAFIIAPYKANLEDYLKILQDLINRKEILELARGLMNDPEKRYAQLYEHIRSFEKERMIE